MSTRSARLPSPAATISAAAMANQTARRAGRRSCARHDARGDAVGGAGGRDLAVERRAPRRRGRGRGRAASSVRAVFRRSWLFTSIGEMGAQATAAARQQGFVCVFADPHDGGGLGLVRPWKWQSTMAARWRSGSAAIAACTARTSSRRNSRAPGSGAGSARSSSTASMATDGTPPAQPVDAQAIGDAVRPGRDAAVRLPVGRLLPEADEHLLDDLLGLGGAVGSVARAKRRSTGVRPCASRGEGGLVALGDGGHRSPGRRECVPNPANCATDPSRISKPTDCSTANDSR